MFRLNSNLKNKQPVSNDHTADISTYFVVTCLSKLHPGCTAVHTYVMLWLLPRANILPPLFDKTFYSIDLGGEWKVTFCNNLLSARGSRTTRRRAKPDHLKTVAQIHPQTSPAWRVDFSRESRDTCVSTTNAYCGREKFSCAEIIVLILKCQSHRFGAVYARTRTTTTPFFKSKQRAALSGRI